MKKPTLSDALKCLELRKQSKRGLRLHPDDSRFIEAMLKSYPEWYQSTELQVFEETKPFGA